MNTTVKTPPSKPGRLLQPRPPKSRPSRPASPVRPPRLTPPASPAGAPATAPPRAAAPARRRAAAAARDPRAAGQRPTSRTPFILLLLGLLGGGLVCLLVINTTLAAASYRIGNLQRSNATATQQLQQLQQQVASEQSPGSIEERAVRLGMRPQQVLNFVDPMTGRRYTMPSTAQGALAVPGYTP